MITVDEDLTKTRHHSLNSYTSISSDGKCVAVDYMVNSVMFVFTVQRLPPPPVVFPPHRRGNLILLPCYLWLSLPCLSVVCGSLCVFCCPLYCFSLSILLCSIVCSTVSYTVFIVHYIMFRCLLYCVPLSSVLCYIVPCTVFQYVLITTGRRHSLPNNLLTVTHNMMTQSAAIDNPNYVNYRYGRRNSDPSVSVLPQPPLLTPGKKATIV